MDLVEVSKPSSYNEIHDNSVILVDIGGDPTKDSSIFEDAQVDGVSAGVIFPTVCSIIEDLWFAARTSGGTKHILHARRGFGAIHFAFVFGCVCGQ